MSDSAKNSRNPYCPLCGGSIKPIRTDETLAHIADELTDVGLRPKGVETPVEIWTCRCGAKAERSRNSSGDM